MGRWEQQLGKRCCLILRVLRWQNPWVTKEPSVKTRAVALLVGLGMLLAPASGASAASVIYTFDDFSMAPSGTVPAGVSVSSIRFAGGFTCMASLGNPPVSCGSFLHTGPVDGGWVGFRITPEPGFSVTYSELRFDELSIVPEESATGWSVHSSLDLSTPIAAGPASTDSFGSQTVGLGGPACTEVTVPVEFRIYGTGGPPGFPGPSQVYLLDNIELGFSVIPEPASAFLVSGGLLALATRSRRRSSPR